MKKYLFILPALFLMTGAGKNIENINPNDSEKQVLSDLENALEKSKELSENKKENKESAVEEKEIVLEQKIILQGKKDMKIEQKIFKLNLPQDKKYLLFNQEDFVTTHDKNVSWNWTELAGEYYYNVAVTLDTNKNYLLITTTPIERSEIPATSYTTFSLSQKDDAIFFNGETYGMSAYVFHRPILFIYED